MQDDSKGVILFLILFVGLMLAIDGFKGFETTRSVLGSRSYECEDRLYTREEGFYLIDDPETQYVETKEYFKCGYKNKNGQWEDVDFVAAEPDLEEPTCYFSGKFRYCDE